MLTNLHFDKHTSKIFKKCVFQKYVYPVSYTLLACFGEFEVVPRSEGLVARVS